MDDITKEKGVVIVDLKSIPEGFNAAEWLHLFKKTGVLIWDSYNGVAEPKALDAEAGLITLDYSDPEAREFAKKLIKEIEE